MNNIKIKEWFQSDKKKAYVIIGCIVVATIAIMITMFAMDPKENVSLKQEEHKVEVNTELNQKVETYLDGMENPELATINFDDVDVKKLGDYTGTIDYKDATYTVKLKVVDTTKPIMTIAKDTYSFALDTDLQNINDTINKELTMSDNSNQEFELLTVVTEVPTSATSIESKLSIKDTSGNESETIVVTIEFTEVEDTTSDDVADAPSNEESSNNGTTGKDSSASNGNGGSGTISTPTLEPTPTPTPEPSPEPTPEPTPQPTPTPPVEKPSTPEYTTPAGALDGGLFNSEDEATNWIFSYTDDPNSKWYHHQATANQLINGQWHAYISLEK